ncbi:MAG TPA: hypothetical protein P5205_18075 [Candidatus Paceibacterota bacterium]|nr:hypothetical protein [Verrucomicrobiota bacterium]HSA12271.1 hypothetical protein [Candidatus Paceibacterota bacterium]
MTFSERQIQMRGWLKVDYFAVTNSLREILAEQALSSEDRARLAFIQNEVLNSAEDNQWARIYRDRWTGRCGANYRRYMDMLEDWGQLGSIRNYKATHDAEAFPMPYWIPQRALSSGLCALGCHRKRLHPPVPKNTPTDDASRYALNCLSALQLATDTDFWVPDDPIRRYLVKDHCEHIFFKDFNLRYGKDSKRLYHRAVMMPSEGRRNLRHPFFPLIEYDLKTCHPYLLQTLFTDDSELVRYQDLLTADIYTEIGRATGGYLREQVKTDFLRVVNPKEKNQTWLGQHYLFRFFKERFPAFTESVLSVRTDLALAMQNFEADLMVQRLGAVCQGHGLFWVPQHDGWISTVNDGPTIENYAQEIVSGAVGFPARFTRELLMANGT